MTYAYLGTNSDQFWQLDAVTSIYRNSMGAVELIFETSYWKKLDDLIRRMSVGDSLHISDLSQLAGTSIDVLEKLTALIGIGVTVTSIKEGGSVDPRMLAFMRTLATEIISDNCP